MPKDALKRIMSSTKSIANMMGKSADGKMPDLSKLVDGMDMDDVNLEDLQKQFNSQDLKKAAEQMSKNKAFGDLPDQENLKDILGKTGKDDFNW